MFYSNLKKHLKPHCEEFPPFLMLHFLLHLESFYFFGILMVLRVPASEYSSSVRIYLTLFTQRWFHK